MIKKWLLGMGAWCAWPPSGLWREEKGLFLIHATLLCLKMKGDTCLHSSTSCFTTSNVISQVKVPVSKTTSWSFSKSATKGILGLYSLGLFSSVCFGVLKHTYLVWTLFLLVTFNSPCPDCAQSRSGNRPGQGKKHLKENLLFTTPC